MVGVQKLAKTCSFVGGRFIVCGKKVHKKFIFPKSSVRSEELCFVDVEDFAIILDTIRRSFFTKSATAALFTSF
jgi:hypothetical protein